MSTKVRVLSSVLLLVCISAESQTAGAAGNVLTVTSAVVEGSCVLNAPESMQFLGVLPEDFAQNGWTAAIQPLVVTVESCDGQGGGALSPALQVSGATLSEANYIFSDPTSPSHSGFMLREGTYTGKLSDFYSATEAIKDKQLTHTGTPGQVWSPGQVFNYSVGFVSAQSRPDTGRVFSALTFSVKYH